MSKIATVTIEEGHDETITCSCDFHKSVSVGRMFSVIGSSIAGMYEVVAKIGQAKGMTEEQIKQAVFGPD